MVAGYEPSEAKCLISGRKAPQPVLRTILCIDIISNAISQRSFARTCRSTLVVCDMVAGYEPSEAKAKCPDSIIYLLWPSGRREVSTSNFFTQPNDHLGRLFRTINCFLNFINTLSVYAKAYSIAEFKKI